MILHCYIESKQSKEETGLVGDRGNEREDFRLTDFFFDVKYILYNILWVRYL